MKEKMKLTKLNQIIAIEKTAKANSEAGFTASYHRAQKSDLFAGLTKVYQPLKEDGTQLPGEKRIVQATVPGIIGDIQASLEGLFDLTATKDTANGHAKANIVVGDVVVAEQVPVSTLLWLEKKLVDLKTVLGKLPVLDSADVWAFDGGMGLYRSEPVSTMRQQKVPKFITIAPATDKHAAQVVRETEDVFEGTWTTTKLSGAIPASRREQLLAQVTELQVAVKVAREEANSMTVTDVRIGARILGYLFR